jgi:hypothetical protein
MDEQTALAKPRVSEKTKDILTTMVTSLSDEKNTARA